MKKIVTLGGSSSKKSINKRLAEYTGGLIHHVDLINIDLNEFEMPLFSVDHENEKGFSKAATSLNEIFENADGFVVSLAEHNGAYAAAFKNTLDWLSRMEGKVWRGKPMILLSSSPGVRGGQTVLEIALGKFPRMGANIVGSMTFPSFKENFKENDVVNATLRTKLEDMVALFEKEI